MRAWALIAVVAIAGCGGGSAKKELRVDMQVVKQGKQVIALVPVTIDGKGPFTFALDTGASQSLVDTAVARKLSVPKTGKHPKIAGISTVEKMATVQVKHWRVGDIELPATTIVAGNLPFGNAKGGVQGLLGSDMLSRFDVITIDYDHEVLRLHERAG
jgi:predicted aspartyl protease